MISSNIGGYTKRSITSAMVFAGALSTSRCPFADPRDTSSHPASLASSAPLRSLIMLVHRYSLLWRQHANILSRIASMSTRTNLTLTCRAGPQFIYADERPRYQSGALAMSTCSSASVALLPKADWQNSRQ